MAGIDAVNQLIEGLPKKEATRFLEHCEVVSLDVGAVPCELGRPVRFVYFPLSGFISLIAEVSGRPPMDVALVGNEGMLGAILTIANRASPFRAIVQGAGSALRTDAATFHRATEDSVAFRKMYNQYISELLMQLAHKIVCTNFHQVQARLALSLLMVHDRVHSAQFHLTHQVLSSMLGVQRSAVTIAAGALQQQHLIDYSRGDITIIDREGLEAASCTCYECQSIDNDGSAKLGIAQYNS